MYRADVYSAEATDVYKRTTQLRTGCSELCVASTYHHPAFVATRCVSVPPPRVCCNLLCFFVPVHGGQCRDHSSERDAVNSVWRARTTTPRSLLLLCFLVPVHCVLCLPFVPTPNLRASSDSPAHLFCFASAWARVAEWQTYLASVGRRSSSSLS